MSDDRSLAPSRRPPTALASIRRRSSCISLVSALAVGLLAGPSASAGPRATPARDAGTAVGAPPPGVAGIYGSRGYLVPDPEGYAKGKAAAERRLDRSPGGVPGGRRAEPGPPPQALVSRPGAFDFRGSPSDSTGAIGPARYVEAVNTRLGIYRRDGSVITVADIGSLAHLGRGYPYLTDPQVIWDAATERFYFVILDFDVVAAGASNGFDFVFAYSKGAAPNGVADWCSYTLSFGYDAPDQGHFQIPDQPHMGDTLRSLMWGVNVFDLLTGPRFIGADVDSISKPGPGRRCQAASEFRTGKAVRLKTPTGERVATAVGANQTDPSTTGYLVATRPVAVRAGRRLYVFEASDLRGGTLHVQRRGRAVDVPPFRMPPSAPQRGGNGKRLDTLDTRLTQAVSAVDPAKRRLAVWTQHTVEGGAGSEVRWYEIDPGHASVLQSGVVSDPDLFVFNGAISPDRVVRPNARKFGAAAVVGFDTSSTSTDVAIQMVSKVPHAPQSDAVMIRRSPGPNLDFTCHPVCRWGDYAGASPDPGARLTGQMGRVWLTNMWNTTGGHGTVDWRTWNWQARP